MNRAEYLNSLVGYEQPMFFYVQYSKNKGFKVYEGRGILEFEQHELGNDVMQVRPRGEFPIADGFDLFIDLPLIVQQWSVDNANLYFGVNIMELSLDKFNLLIQKLQQATEMTEQEVLQQFANILLVQPSEVFQNIRKVGLIGVNVKSKDLKIYVKPDDIIQL